MVTETGQQPMVKNQSQEPSGEEGEQVPFNDFVETVRLPKRRIVVFLRRLVVTLFVVIGLVCAVTLVLQNMVLPAKAADTKVAYYKAVKELGFEPMTFAPAEPGVESSVDSVLAKFGSCVYRFTLSRVPLQATTAQAGKTVVSVIRWVDGKQTSVDQPITAMIGDPQYDSCGVVPPTS